MSYANQDRIQFEARTRGLVRILRDFLRNDGGWVESSIIEERSWFDKRGKRFKPSTVGRKLRLMAAKQVLEVSDTRGKSVWYRYNVNGVPKKQEYRMVEREGVRMMVPV